jgi:hypothetical protein
MKLTDAERRILRTALRELDNILQSDFDALREYHRFLCDGDGEVDVNVLALKLGVELADDAR